MIKILIYIMLGFIILPGCASLSKPGQITSIKSDKEAILPLSQNPVKIGDVLNVYKHGCYGVRRHNVSPITGTVHCREDYIGQAKVIEINNESQARLQMLSDAQFGFRMYAFKEDQATFEAKKKKAEQDAIKWDPKVYKYEYNP